MSNPADPAVAVWGRLGVPEVWRCHVLSWTLSFWHRQPDGTYSEGRESAVLPKLTVDDVMAHLRRADDVEADPWVQEIRVWAHQVLVPRQTGGG